MSAKSWVQLLTLSLLWGVSYLIVEVALSGLPALTVALCRVALAAMFLLIGLAVTSSQTSRGAELWRAVFVMGLLNTAVPFRLFALAQGQINGSFAAILNATPPLFTVIVAHMATIDEQVGPLNLTGLALGFSGAVAMVTAGGASDAGSGPAFCLLAAFSCGLVGVWGGRFRRLGGHL